jgi:hypothetical protein
VAGFVVAGCSLDDGHRDGGKKPFLTPLPGLAERLANDPVLRVECDDENYHRPCPDIVVYGGQGGPGPLIPPPVIGTEAPNIKVEFRVTDVTNEAISGNGISASEHFVFRADIPLPNTSMNWGWGLQLPPGETTSVDLPISRSIILGGCTSPPPVIPVEFSNEIWHTVTVSENPLEFSSVEIGSFEAADDSSLVPTGYWVFDYRLLATTPNSDASEFHVRGTVSVVCTVDEHP